MGRYGEKRTGGGYVHPLDPATVVSENLCFCVDVAVKGGHVEIDVADIFV